MREMKGRLERGQIKTKYDRQNIIDRKCWTIKSIKKTMEKKKKLADLRNTVYSF